MLHPHNEIIPLDRLENRSWHRTHDTKITSQMDFDNIGMYSIFSCSHSGNPIQILSRDSTKHSFPCFGFWPPGECDTKSFVSHMNYLKLTFLQQIT